MVWPRTPLADAMPHIADVVGDGFRVTDHGTADIRICIVTFEIHAVAKQREAPAALPLANADVNRRRILVQDRRAILARPSRQGTLLMPVFSGVSDGRC